MDRKLRYVCLIGLALLFYLCLQLRGLGAWGGVAVLTGLKAILFVGIVALAYVEVLERRRDL